MPPAVSRVVLQALSRAPRDRFKSAMRLASALEQAYDPNAPPPTPPRLRPESPGRGARPPGARRSTADRVVVLRGLSRKEERREKRRLHEEQERIRQQELAERRAVRQVAMREKRREFLARWGRSMVVVAVVLLLIGAAFFLLQTLGVLSVQVANPLPTRSAAVAAAAGDSGTATQPPTSTPTAAPSPTPAPTPTALQVSEATAIAPIAFAPLDVGASAFRLADAAVLQFVPAGTFLMGTNDKYRSPDARPQHSVMLSDYWIDRTEVTNAQYALCVEHGLCQPPVSTRYYDLPKYADYPVTYVRQSFAVTYCLWLAQDTGQPVGLPTEAQWEKAADWDPVTQVARIYPWGNKPPADNLLQYRGSLITGLRPAGSHPDGASAYGALDMAGSVWEWVSDWYADDYYQRSGLPVDPTGPASGTRRVTRGGGWFDTDLLVQSSVRNWALPTAAGDDLGFRCAVNVKRPNPASGIVLTPLDLTGALLDLLDTARSDPNNNSAALDEWTSAVTGIQTALQAGDNATASTLTAERLARLTTQNNTGLLVPELAYRLDKALRWTRDQIAPPG